MKKKLIALALIICLTLSLAPMAFAEGRETDILTDQPHSDVNYSDMEYTPVTEAEFTAAIDATRALISDAANAEATEEAFDYTVELFMTVRTNLTLLTLRTSQNIDDDESQDLYMAQAALYYDIYDPFIFLVRDILKSPCASILDDDGLTQDDKDYYLAYTGTSEEAKALSLERESLGELYWDAYYDDYTYTYKDVELTAEEAQQYYSYGLIPADDYAVIMTSIERDRNAAMGEVFMQVLDLNTKLAKAQGYSNYAEYAYEVEYARDYSASDILAFADAVKQYIVPLSDDIYSLYIHDIYELDEYGYMNVYLGDYTGRGTLDAIRPYIGNMSSELLESWDYMVNHGLYDITARDTKEDSGFTTIIPSYGAPFFFNRPSEFLVDFLTVLHEFGHYNNFYYHPSGWNDGRASYDVSEVHSQGMELLFSKYYKNLFGKNADLVQDLLMGRLLGDAIVYGAMCGELELYASSTPDVTLEMVNRKYRELSEEYGFTEPDDPATELYDWIETPHLTVSPMYYISYATSAAGAFTFWLEAKTDGYDAAVDHYLRFVSQSVYSPFLEQFESAGMENPLSPEYIRDLAEALRASLDIDERLDLAVKEELYDDVSADDWFFENVCEATELGLMSGIGNGEFDPDGTSSRAMAAMVLWNLDGNTESTTATSFPDVNETDWYLSAALWAGESKVINGYGDGTFAGNENVTREQMAVMIYNYAKYCGLDTSVTSTALDFHDASEVHSWALDGMAWCVEHDIFQGTDTGLLQPRQDITRAQLAKVIVTAAHVIYGE